MEVVETTGVLPLPVVSKNEREGERERERERKRGGCEICAKVLETKEQITQMVL